jgi:transmembrane sensor
VWKDKTMPVEDRSESAIAWLARLTNPAAPASDWALFTEWLEADPANADAYDAVALVDAELSETISDIRSDPQLPHNDNEPVPARWYERRSFLAVAASAALALLMTPVLMAGRDLQLYETRPGEKKEIALADGSKIELNGGTRLQLDQKSNRFARIEAGEAVFTIRHDAYNPFVIETAGATLRDIGTIFNVRQDDDSLEVTVAEGAVEYNPKAEAVTVAAGNRLNISRDQPRPTVTKTDPASVAGWRQGRLSYQQARLSVIALDLSRAIGAPVSVSQDLSNQRFTGVIRVDKDRNLLFRRLEGLLGVRARKNDKGWELTS